MDPSERSLVHAVQILASPAEAQIAHYPAFVRVGDELALDFRDACRRYLAAATNITAEHSRSIAELDRYLAELSNTDTGRYWADRDAVRNDPRWSQVRARAAVVLDAFGWAHEVPPPSDTIYIEGLGIRR